MTAWTAIIPVKAWDHAKTRLALDSVLRARLAQAFFADVLAAVTACPLVDHVVIAAQRPDDVSRYAAGAIQIRAAIQVLGDRAGSPSLRDAVRGAATTVTGPVVVVPADLPALRPADLTAVLAAGIHHTCAFVPDISGHGTTLLMAQTPDALRIAYGPGSAALHRGLEAAELATAPTRARHDVDTLTDLHTALDLGVGEATQTALAPTHAGT